MLVIFVKFFLSQKKRFSWLQLVFIHLTNKKISDDTNWFNKMRKV